MVVDVPPEVHGDAHDVGERCVQVVYHRRNETGYVGKVPLERVEQAEQGLNDDSPVPRAIFLTAEPFPPAAKYNDDLSLVQQGHEYLHEHVRLDPQKELSVLIVLQAEAPEASAVRVPYQGLRASHELEEAVGVVYSQVVQEGGQIELKQPDAADCVFGFNEMLFEGVEGVFSRRTEPEELSVEGTYEVLVEKLQDALLQREERVS